MDTNSGNNKKSKIEQIRIDLEKKFEALEKARLKKIESKKTNEDIKEKVSEEIKSIKKEIELPEKVKPTEELKVEEEVDSESVEIVLGERIVIEENKDVSYDKIIKEDVVSIDMLEENINQKGDDIEEKVSQVVASSVLEKDLSNRVEATMNKTPKDNIDVKAEQESNKNIEVVPNQKEASSGGVLDKDEYIEVNEEEEKSKSSKLGYFIYGLAGILLLVAGYFLLDFFKETKTFEQEKMEILISKYKNKSYLDSIELVDANNQLLDFQNQQFIDSISNAYELELKAGDRGIARNTSSRNNNNSNRDRENERKRQVSAVVAVKEVKSKEVKIKVKEAPLSVNKENTVSDVVIEGAKTDSSNNKSEVEAAKELASKEEKSTEEKEKNEELEVAKKTSKKIGLTKSPIYPGCAKKRSEVEKKKCLTSKMLRHIQRKFNSDLVQDVGLKQGINKIKVSFVIDKNGYANVLQVRTDNKKLEKEAIRVIQSLPKMTPGRVNGKTAQMKYVIPIQFKVRD